MSDRNGGSETKKKRKEMAPLMVTITMNKKKFIITNSD